MLGVLVGSYFQNGFLEAVQTPTVISDPDIKWLEKTIRDGRTAYKIIIPPDMDDRIVGIPVARNAEVWSPSEISRKLTLAPNDGIPEVTSIGFDDQTGVIIIFWDADAMRRYGNRPYYTVIYYGGESVNLSEIEERYSKQIGNTGVYVAQIPVGFGSKKYTIFKVFVQAPPPELTYEINWYNRVDVKFAPDCDC